MMSHEQGPVEPRYFTVLLGGGFKHVLFSSLFGEMIQFDEHIFQMGWFDHQLDYCLMGEIWLTSWYDKYTILYMVLAPSQVVGNGISAINTYHPKVHL